MRLEMDLNASNDGSDVLARMEEDHPLDYRAKYFKETMQHEDIYRPYSPQLGMSRNRSPYSHVSSSTSTPTSSPPPTSMNSHIATLPSANRLSPLSLAMDGQVFIPSSMNGLPTQFNGRQGLPIPTSSVAGSPNTLVLPIMRSSRRKCSPIPDNAKDDAYWEKRKRNNQSAKRSREMKRIKGIETYARVMFLEQENVMLRTQVQTLKEEIDKLREMVFHDRSGHKYNCYHGNYNNES